MSSEMDAFRDQLERHEERLDRHEVALDDHLRRLVVAEDRQNAHSQRLHRIENDRASIKALVRTTQLLAEQTRALAAKVSAGADQAERLIETAAERAVEKAYGRRIENRWKLVTRLATALAAIGGFGYLIAYLIIR